MSYILVAEDDKFLANAYRMKLTKAGFDVTIARDGQEALDEIKKKIPDCMLLDLVMPVKDGFAVLEEIKKDEKMAHVPIIVASNLGQKEDIDRALSLGAKECIVKSNMSLESIIAKINQVVKK